jgi:hypothetical protein
VLDEVDDVVAAEAEERDEMVEEVRVRGVSLNWNVILLFVSNHRGFGRGSKRDCLTDWIPVFR